MPSIRIPAGTDLRKTEAEYDANTERVCAKIMAKDAADHLKERHARAQRQMAAIWKGALVNEAASADVAREAA